MKHLKFGKHRNDGEEEMMMIDNGIALNQNDITHQDSTISFYSDVDDQSISNLIGLIREKNMLCAKVQYQFNLPEPPPIHLHIQSYGGLLFSGFAGMEIIRNNPIPIYTYVDGMAASAATFLSCVGTKRFMYKESSIMIHQLSSGFWGKYEEFIQEKKNLDMLMERIKRVYTQYTNIEGKMLKDILSKDLYMTSDECLKHGLVDSII